MHAIYDGISQVARVGAKITFCLVPGQVWLAGNERVDAGPKQFPKNFAAFKLAPLGRRMAFFNREGFSPVLRGLHSSPDCREFAGRVY